MDSQPIDSGLRSVPAIALARQLGESLADLPDLLKAGEPAMKLGVSLGELRGLTSEDLEPVYQAACELCDAEQFSDALPAALQLAAHAPHDERFAFIAATCLQRLDMYRSAWMMFLGCAKQGGQLTDVAMFRAGECLAADGQVEQARQALEACYEVCRADPELRDLQQRCERALARMS